MTSISSKEYGFGFFERVNPEIASDSRSWLNEKHGFNDIRTQLRYFWQIKGLGSAIIDIRSWTEKAGRALYLIECMKDNAEWSKLTEGDRRLIEEYEFVIVNKIKENMEYIDSPSRLSTSSDNSSIESEDYKNKCGTITEERHDLRESTLKSCSKSVGRWIWNKLVTTTSNGLSNIFKRPIDFIDPEDILPTSKRRKYNDFDQQNCAPTSTSEYVLNRPQNYQPVPQHQLVNLLEENRVPKQPSPVIPRLHLSTLRNVSSFSDQPVKPETNIPNTVRVPLQSKQSLQLSANEPSIKEINLVTAKPKWLKPNDLQTPTHMSLHTKDKRLGCQPIIKPQPVDCKPKPHIPEIRSSEIKITSSRYQSPFKVNSPTNHRRAFSYTCARYKSPIRRDTNFNEDKTKDIRRGLTNVGNTCYINAVIQSLGATELSDDFLNVDTDLKGIARAYQSLALQMQCNDPEPVDTSEFKKAVQKRDSYYTGTEQQDSHEFLRSLLDWLEEDTKDIQHEVSVSKNFHFNTRSQVICTYCCNITQSYETSSTLELPLPSINQKTSLVECLDIFTSEEILDSSNRFKCSRCYNSVEACKQIRFVTCPKILALSLKRFLHTHGALSHKLDTTVDIPKILDMTPYIVEKNITSGKISNKFELVAIVNHTGTINQGHYTADVKGKTDQLWFRFSDELVMPTPQFDNNNAYLLFYHRTS